jgi:folate-dependent phosphoribosylglycinamide formyltransferase PurN
MFTKPLRIRKKETGITIHYVNEHYDEGGVVFQKKVIFEVKRQKTLLKGSMN